MATDSAILIAGLLFIAAALGYVFARFGDDSGDAPPPDPERMNSEYIKGLNFLLNEQPDQALEVFIRMVEVDENTLETHYALGGLFRRRGEVDRAIRIHQNLIARPNLDQTQRDQAFFALAEDYLGAGLYDRAESLFLQLRESPDHCDPALLKLVRICELTNDWQKAIEYFRELESHDAVSASPDQVAHYLCEQAEQALAGGDLDAAAALLKEADERAVETIRTRLAQANCAQAGGDHDKAIELYERVIGLEPRLASEVIPALARSCRAVGRSEDMARILNSLKENHQYARDAIALATIRDADIDHAVALECLAEFTATHPILSSLIDMEQMNDADAAVRAAALGRVRAALARIAMQSPRYRCNECGYATMELLWQCPSCREWETVVPAQQLALGSMLS